MEAIATRERLSELGKYLDVECLEVLGGGDLRETRRRIRKSTVHVIVGTLGRINDIIARKFIAPEPLEIFVVIGGDNCLSTGFQDELRSIVQTLPLGVQMVMTTETLPADLVEIADKMLRKPARFIERFPTHTL